MSTNASLRICTVFEIQNCLTDRGRRVIDQQDGSFSSLVDTVQFDEVLQLSLWVDLDALRVQGATQLWRVLFVVNSLNLRCGECHNLRDMDLVR